MKKLLVVLVLASVVLLTACGGGAPSVGWSRPALGDSTLYIMSRGGRVYALESATGVKKWQYPADNSKTIVAAASSLYAAPVVAGNYLIVASSDKLVHVLNKENGDKHCTFETGESIIATPAYADGVVYVGSSDAKPDLTKNLDLSRIPDFFRPAAHKVYAIDLNKPVKDGVCARQWEFETKDKVWAEPLVLGDRLYVTALDRRLYALDRTTGRKVWEFEAGGAIASAPKHANGVLYFGSFDTKVYAVDAASGRAAWTQPAPTGNWVWADPLIAGDNVIIGSLDGNVYAFDAKNGLERWKAYTGPVRAAAAAGRDGIVFVGSEDAKLFALRTADGTAVWSRPAEAGGRILASPTLSNGAVVVQTINNLVLAFDAATGAKKWEFATDK